MWRNFFPLLGHSTLTHQAVATAPSDFTRTLLKWVKRSLQLPGELAWNDPAMKVDQFCVVRSFSFLLQIQNKSILKKGNGNFFGFSCSKNSSDVFYNVHANTANFMQTHAPTPKHLSHNFQDWPMPLHSCNKYSTNATTTSNSAAVAAIVTTLTAQVRHDFPSLFKGNATFIVEDMNSTLNL